MPLRVLKRRRLVLGLFAITASNCMHRAPGTLTRCTKQMNTAAAAAADVRTVPIYHQRQVNIPDRLLSWAVAAGTAAYTPPALLACCI